MRISWESKTAVVLGMAAACEADGRAGRDCPLLSLLALSPLAVRVVKASPKRTKTCFLPTIA